LYSLVQPEEKIVKNSIKKYLIIILAGGAEGSPLPDEPGLSWRGG